MTKAYKGMAMEGAIARWYNRNTREGREFDALAQRICRIIAPGSNVLEVAPGPGYLAIEIARRGNYRVAGVEISKTFVEIEKANAQAAGVTIDFRRGDAADLPFADATFDLVVCVAAFKNFSRPAKALAEMQRVLAPGGKALVIDLRHDASRAAINREVDGMGLNGLNAALTKLTFSAFLLRNAYTEEQMQAFLRDAHISNARIETSGIVFEVWLEKSSGSR